VPEASVEVEARCALAANDGLALRRRRSTACRKVTESTSGTTTIAEVLSEAPVISYSQPSASRG
jgi:hypothetical protein